jgi:hypothetical protein
MQNRDLRIGIHLLDQVVLVAVCQKHGELMYSRGDPRLRMASSRSHLRVFF